MKNLSYLLLISAISLDNFGDAISVNQMVNQQIQSGASSSQGSRQKMGLKQKTGVMSNQQLLAEVMLKEYPVTKDQSLVSVTQSSYEDAEILAQADEDGTDSADAIPAEVSGMMGQQSANGTASSADSGDAEVAANQNSTASNKLDDDVIDRTRNWMNHKLDIKDINETDPIYGHKVFKDEMNRFLPYHAKKPVNRRWQYGWHQMAVDVDHTDDWDKDLTKGGDKATEGYYPLDEEDEEKTWARRNGHYSNYGPWNYRWGQNFYNNGGYRGNPNLYGGYPQPYPYAYGNYNPGGNWGRYRNWVGSNAQSNNDADKECKRNPDGTCKTDESTDDGSAVQVEAQSMVQTEKNNANPFDSAVQTRKAQLESTKFIKNESGIGAEGDIDADWY